MNVREILRRLGELERRKLEIDRVIDYGPTRAKLEEITAAVLTGAPLPPWAAITPHEAERRRTSPAWAEIRRRLDQIAAKNEAVNA
jgi:hypothetical protein